MFILSLYNQFLALPILDGEMSLNAPLITLNLTVSKCNLVANSDLVNVADLKCSLLCLLIL